MAVLTCEEKQSMDQACQKMLHYPGIRFVGVINQMGNLVAGGFKYGVKPLTDDESRRILFMQLVLEVNMRHELDDVLGPVKYIEAKRGKVRKITIPLNKRILVISAELNTEGEEITKTANEIFQGYLDLNA
ncbi:MAG: DUF6659 family protein [Nitrosarchaeum sp.]